MFLIVVYPHRKVSCLMKYSPLRRLSVLPPSIGQCPLIVISLSSSDTDNNYYNIIMSSVFRGWYPKNHLSLDVDLNFTNNMSLQSTIDVSAPSPSLSSAAVNTRFRNQTANDAPAIPSISIISSSKLITL